MSKNFKVIVKQQPNLYSEDIISGVDINGEVVLDKELRDGFMSIRHIDPKNIEDRKEEQWFQEYGKNKNNEHHKEDKKEKVEREEKGKEHKGDKKEKVEKEEKDKKHKEDKKEKIEKEEKGKEHKEDKKEKVEKEEKDKKHKEDKKEKIEKEEKDKKHKEDKKEKIEKEEKGKEHKEDKKEKKINPFLLNNTEIQDSRKRTESIITESEKVLKGRGQVYRSKKINIDKPEKDVVIKIGNIDRSIYIENIEMLKDGANILAMVVENITYYTAKPIPPKPEKKENSKHKKTITCELTERECICLDGVVRNTTVISPCLIYLDIIGAKETDTYEVESASVEGIDTKYVLDNGSIVDNNSLLIENYIESLIEGYIITISIVVK
ncbi:hypothetical protein QJR60_13680 [Paraclostridium sordellii]|uniref:hypothetical protein n=1 Tax=Paraclostridium sordellii TaxID=1505 RepID=UPI00189879B0|nr:hypothetical protein [Paeniclostridium sordellii]